jgi:uncharacterized protein
VAELAPVAPRERVVTLDVLRGFALAGVLLANLYSLYSLRFAHRGAPPTETIDVIANSFIGVVVHSKAQTLLTFLFGFGFAAQLLRAEARGEPVMGLYVRRMCTLFGIGWMHVLLLSWVDVTWGYALVGFALLAFVRVSNRARTAVAIVCVIVPSIVYAVPGVREWLHGILFASPRQAYIQEYATAAKSGDRIAIMHAHATLALLWTFGGGVLWYLPWLLGRFLFGFVAGSQRWFDRDGADRLPLFHKLLGFGALAAIPALVIQTLTQAGVLSRQHSVGVEMLVSVLGEIGLLGQTALYVAVVVILMQRARWRRVLELLAPVGRMPLTTYLSQSAICTALFYGWGLDWDTPPPAATVGLGLAIFAVQIAVAHAWLRVFRFGPAEWLWRRIVYLRPQPMR